MCFPSSCSAFDIQTSLAKTINKETPFKTVGVTYNVSSSEEFCSDYMNPKIFGVQEIIFSILSFTLVILVVIGTIGDCFGKAKENPGKLLYVNKLCLSFSIRKNWNELFKFQSNREETQILNGIKSISVIIIFCVHFFILVSLIPRINSFSTGEVYISKIRLAVEKMDLIVDTFFLMSGLLSVYGILKKSKTVYFNPIWLVFLRYIRLTPLNMYVSMYFVTMFPYFGSGPMWNFTYVLYKGCIKNNNWWLNILYINNFVEDISGYAPYMGLETKEFGSYTNNYYIKPYTRGSSYFIGMIAGIVYDKLKSRKVKLSKMTSYAFTGISLLAMVVSYFYLFFAYNGQENYKFEFFLYNALHRPIWCSGILGICIAASFGSIPTIRLFLSSSFWTPLAKLTYGFYLSHIIVQHATLTTLNTGIRIEFFNMANLWLALLGISFIVSSFLYVIVEAPFMQTLKIFTQAKFYEKHSVTKMQQLKKVQLPK